MPIVSGGGGGAGLAIPVDVAGTGTRFQIDNAGTLTLTGKGGNIADIELVETASSEFASLTSGGSVSLSAAHALVQAQNAAVTSGAELGVDVGLVTFRNSAPTDINLFPGACSLWFDKTNGAAKLMLKGQTTDGTTVTASIALA